MRTTLTLDDDVAIRLNRLREKNRSGLKETVNRVLREGLKQLEAEPEPAAPFRTATVSAGRCRIGDLAKISDALALAEGDDYK